MSIPPKENGDLPASQMTKREMMAMHIASGYISNYHTAKIAHDSIDDADNWLSRRSVCTADALLAELAKETK